MKQAIDESGEKLTDSDKRNCKEECDNALCWLDNNTLADKEELKDKLVTLQKVCSPIMTKLHGVGKPSIFGGSIVAFKIKLFSIQFFHVVFK